MSPETQLRLVSTPFSGLVQRGIALNFGYFFRFGQIKNGQGTMVEEAERHHISSRADAELQRMQPLRGLTEF